MSDGDPTFNQHHFCASYLPLLIWFWNASHMWYFKIVSAFLHFVHRELKGRICHFVKWQIRYLIPMAVYNCGVKIIYIFLVYVLLYYSSMSLLHRYLYVVTTNSITADISICKWMVNVLEYSTWCQCPANTRRCPNVGLLWFTVGPTSWTVGQQ